MNNKEMTPERLERCNQISQCISQLKAIHGHLYRNTKDSYIKIGNPQSCHGEKSLDTFLSSDLLLKARVYISSLVSENIKTLEEKFKDM